MVALGASLDAADAGGGTPLHDAAGKGFAAIVVMLTELGATVNKQDNDDRTALDDASLNGWSFASSQHTA